MLIEVKNKHTHPNSKIILYFPIFRRPPFWTTYENVIIYLVAIQLSMYSIYQIYNIKLISTFIFYLSPISPLFLPFVTYILLRIQNESIYHTSIYLYVLPFSSLPIFRPFLAEITPWILWIKILALLPLLLLYILQILGLHIPCTVRSTHRYKVYL